MSIINKIITRGLGPARDGIGNIAGPITRGYAGSFIEQVIDTAHRRVIHGVSGKREKYSDIVVYAKLIEVNNKEPERKLEGWKKVPASAAYAESLVEFVINRVKDVLVNVSRIK